MRGTATLVCEPVDPTAEEAALVRDWLAGDAGAFDALYARHHPALVRLLRGRVGSTAAAEDLAQEVMIRALGRLADFDHRGPLWPWLRRIAINASIDAARARSRADALAAHLARTPDRPTAVPDAGDGLPERDVLSRALAEVPARQRAALERCYVQGWRPSEAAADFGVCPNAFDQLLHRARANLRSAYLRQHEEGHRAAHLGWLLAGVAHLEALSGRVRALSGWAGALGEAVPRLGEAAAATVAAATAVAVLGASGGGGAPLRPADLADDVAVDRIRIATAPAETGPRTGDGGDPARPAGGGPGASAGEPLSAGPATAGASAPFRRPDGPPPPTAPRPGAPEPVVPLPIGGDPSPAAGDPVLPDPMDPIDPVAPVVDVLQEGMAPPAGGGAPAVAPPVVEGLGDAAADVTADVTAALAGG